MKFTAKTVKVGYFEHWTQPEYKFVDFLREEGFEVTKIDYSKKFYLEPFDVVLIEQHGFNDYIENDENYIRDWVKRGGLLFFMHQSYERWAPYFLPEEVGYTQLIHRYVDTIITCRPAKFFTNSDIPYKIHMTPWIEDCGKKLFSEPEVITPDEMIDWNVKVNFLHDPIRRAGKETEIIKSTADCCFLLPKNWEVIGSYMDPAVRNGALIAKTNYGKGQFFVNQILFPNFKPEDGDRCISFWKKYVKNLFAYFARFKNGESEEMVIEKKSLPIKKNYKLCIHMHSLDWYAADTPPGTINAIMRHRGIDISSIAVKDKAPFEGGLDVEKYSDDKVLLLHGQEYHPFNWGDSHADLSHNGYHIIAIGMNGDDYTMKYTCSLFGDKEVDEHLKGALDYVHKSGGVACATHPHCDYWVNYDYDAIDMEPLISAVGSDIEKHWLKGKAFPVMVSVDLYGVRRIFDNPATNFIYLKDKQPNRDNVCQAIKDRNTIAATGFDEVDITLGDFLPGDYVTVDDLKNNKLSIKAKIIEDCEEDVITQVRVYSADKLIWSKTDLNQVEVDYELSLEGYELDKFVRVEVEGRNEYHISVSTPFFIK